MSSLPRDHGGLPLMDWRWFLIIPLLIVVRTLLRCRCGSSWRCGCALCRPQEPDRTGVCDEEECPHEH